MPGQDRLNFIQQTLARAGTGWTQAAAVAVLAALPVAAFAQSFQDWQLTCADGTCALSQTIAAEGEVWLATIRLQLGGDILLAEVLVPSGVHLASGIFLQSGAAMVAADWQRCTPQVCRAALGLDDGMTAQWQRGVAAQVRYRPAPDAPVVAFDLSLMGLTAGLAALEVAR